MSTKDLSDNEILQIIQQHPGDKIKVAITDVDSVLRGKLMHKQKFLDACAPESSFGFCNVIFGWDSNDNCYDSIEYTGWHTGYPDASARIDVQSFRQIPWDNKVPFFLADFYDHSQQGHVACPRSLLKNIKKQADNLGFSTCFSQEFEWFNFYEEPHKLEEKGHVRPQPISPGMFGYSILRQSRNSDYFNDIFEQLNQFRIPIEGLHTETGPGVYEAAILYTEILEAADRASLFKTAIKEIGMRHGILPSFMAKWNENYPGCSGHIHQSLWSSDKNQNLFYSEDDPNKMSQLMKHYLAGQLHCLPHILPMYAPTINSYKRLTIGAWAPTTVTWGIDNRTTAIRVLPGSNKSTRIEFRVSGSDVNPYLSMAACLASGLYGIKNKLDLTVEMTRGNGYDKHHQKLARTLDEATQLMKTSDLAHELFGESFVKHFTKTREWEWEQHLKAVTDWEIRRYFEII